MSKKYLVKAGWMTSKTDGDRHFISAKKLMDLYRVNPRECVIFSDKFKYLDDVDLIVLTPRYDGNYNLGDLND